MTDPLFPFEIRLHRDAFSVHKVHHVSLTDPVLADPDKVKAWHVWRQFDNLTAPTKYKDWQRNSDNTDWLFLNAWYLDQEYADGQVPVADADGYFLPGDAGGAESGGPIDGAGTGGLIAKWADSNTLEDSSLDENTSDITSTKPLYLPAGTTSVPSLRLPHGAAPTSPTNGDLWSTTAGFFGRVNGGTVGPFGAGGAGASWVLDVDEDGSSFAAFTAVSGTWASSGGTINQTDTSGERYAYLTAKQVLGLPLVFEAEVQFVGASADNDRVGLAIGGTTADQVGSLLVYLRYSSGVRVEVGSTTVRMAATFAWGDDNNFHLLRVITSGGGCSVYVDGTLVGSAAVGWMNQDGHYLALYCNATECKFQNIKLYTLTGGLP